MGRIGPLLDGAVFKKAIDFTRTRAGMYRELAEPEPTEALSGS
jgi:hypothetical protein